MESKKPLRLAAQFRFISRHIAQTSIPSSNYSPSSRHSSEKSPHTPSRMPHSPSAAYARPSPGASIRSPEPNAPRTSQIQDMVDLTGNRFKRSKAAHHYLVHASDPTRRTTVSVHPGD